MAISLGYSAGPKLACASSSVHPSPPAPPQVALHALSVRRGLRRGVVGHLTCNGSQQPPAQQRQCRRPPLSTRPVLPFPRTAHRPAGRSAALSPLEELKSSLSDGAALRIRTCLSHEQVPVICSSSKKLLLRKHSSSHHTSQHHPAAARERLASAAACTRTGPRSACTSAHLRLGCGQQPVWWHLKRCISSCPPVR